MKTKELEVGKQYAIKEGHWTVFVGTLLSKEQYKRGVGRGHGRDRWTGYPVNKALGERGGLPFAIQSRHYATHTDGTETEQVVWVPYVAQPANIFAPAETYEEAEAERQAQLDAQREREEAEFERRRAQSRWNRYWKEYRIGLLNWRLANSGLPPVKVQDQRYNYVTRTYDLIATVDDAFLEQVLERVGA